MFTEQTRVVWGLWLLNVLCVAGEDVDVVEMHAMTAIAAKTLSEGHKSFHEKRRYSHNLLCVEYLTTFDFVVPSHFTILCILKSAHITDYQCIAYNCCMCSFLCVCHTFPDIS